MTRQTLGVNSPSDGQTVSRHRMLQGAILGGVLALFYSIITFFGSPLNAFPVFVLLVFLPTCAYAICQLLCSWYVYWKTLPPVRSASTPDLTMDVFVTAYKEPYDMVRTALQAACALRGPHRTYLLDDSATPEFETLALSLGATYLTRAERQDAKAGNINAALPRSDGDLIAIFDTDHVPTPDYLERVLPAFADKDIGFVQVMLTFENGNERWVARAATETSLDFYNPTSIGMGALRCVTMMGSNSILRREALASIGGYRPGLAEDLATSLALHAAGWRSAYVPHPLAPGLAPDDVLSWFTQQLKWARGVFEVMVTDFPKSWGRLTGAQRACYSVRMTNYWVGPLTMVYALATLWFLMSANAPLQSAFERYLVQLTPLVASFVLIRRTAMETWRSPDITPRPFWRAIALVYFTWPIYSLAWIMTGLRLPLAFRPTPKAAAGGIPLAWLTPQLLVATALGVGIFLLCDKEGWRSAFLDHPVILGFATLQIILPVIVPLQRLRPERLRGLRKEYGSAPRHDAIL